MPAVRRNLQKTQFVFQPGMLNDEKDLFVQQFRFLDANIPADEVVNRLSETLSMDDLVSLFAQTTRNDPAVWPGLKVYYGLDDYGYQMVYIYRPVNLRIFENDMPANGIDRYDIEEVGNYWRTIYNFGTTQFSTITDANALDLIANYQANIYINEGGQYRHYDYDVKRDIKAITFPLHEFVWLIEQNRNLLNASGMSLAFTINSGTPEDLYNMLVYLRNNHPNLGAKFVCGTKLIDGQYRHKANLNPAVRRTYGSGPIPKPGDYTGMSANFGGLCPPNCDRVYYTAE